MEEETLCRDVAFNRLTVLVDSGLVVTTLYDRGNTKNH